jgi:prepilin-type N-terminal cleavage/methylation domain-containing protein
MKVWRDERGFTLAELLTALAVLALVLAAVVTVQRATFSAFLIGSNKSAMQQSARVALERMARELRESTGALTTATATTIAFTHQDLAAPNNSVTYTVVGTNLMRTEGGNPAQVFIGGVQSLTFSYFKGDGAAAVTAAEARRIDITIRTRPEDPSVRPGSAEDSRAEVSTTVRLRNVS